MSAQTSPIAGCSQDCDQGRTCSNACSCTPELENMVRATRDAGCYAFWEDPKEHPAVPLVEWVICATMVVFSVAGVFGIMGYLSAKLLGL